MAASEHTPQFAPPHPSERVADPGEGVAPRVTPPAPWPSPVPERRAEGDLAVGEPDRIPPRRLHPLSPLLSGGVLLLRSWPILLIAFARSMVWPVIVLAVGLVAWRFVAWSRTSYAVDDDGLVIRSGIVWRNVQTVPPQRVQQVEIRRSLRHRAVGVANVHVGLAGAGESGEVELDAVSEHDAAQLQRILERWRARHRRDAAAERGADTGAAGASGDGVAAASPPGVPIFSASTVQLLVAGLTSRSLWLAPLAAFAGLVQFVFDARLNDEATGAVRDRVAETSPALVLVVVTMVALLVATAASVVRHHGLTVTPRAGELVVRRGLLEERVATVPIARVQVVELTSHVIRDRFDLAALEVRTASPSGQSAATDSATAIPIGRRGDIEALAAQFLPPVTIPDVLRRHPRAAVRRSVIRRAVRLVPVAAAIGLFVGGPDAVAWSALAGLAVAVPTGWLAGRRLRTAWSADAIVTQRGAIAWRRWVVPVARLQSAAVLRSPFQRRLGLATVRLDIAGSAGGVVVRDLAEHDAWRLAGLAAGTTGGVVDPTGATVHASG